MIASLPMYDRPANAAAHDQLWDLIRDNLRDAGVDAPDALDRDTGYMTGWGRDDLVLGQICNLPLRAKFRPMITMIGAADYGLPDCPAGHYNSVFIVHRNADGDSPMDFIRGRFASNGLMSHSGYGAPQAWALDHGAQFSAPMITGSHDRSLAMVANGRADIAAIDAQTWAMQQVDSEDAANVRVIGTTAPSPSMTFITRAGQDPAPYFAAIKTAITDLPAECVSLLGLRDILALPHTAYDLPLPPMPQTIDA